MWERSYRPVFNEVADKTPEALRLQSLQRVKSLFGLLSDNEIGMLNIMPQFSLGSLRSLTQFESIVGVNFKSREIFEYAENAVYLNPTDSVLFESSCSIDDLISLNFRNIEDESNHQVQSQSRVSDKKIYDLINEFL